MYQMAVKYTNIVHCKTLQNLHTLVLLVWKYAIWQLCPRVLLPGCFRQFHSLNFISWDWALLWPYSTYVHLRNWCN
jgi:hypothetical protein